MMVRKMIVFGGKLFLINAMEIPKPLRLKVSALQEFPLAGKTSYPLVVSVIELISASKLALGGKLRMGANGILLGVELLWAEH
ncbi:hypothetical protein SLA2020_475830 [Shorea laevis]